jgi:alpha-D-xyloside xylohydrolase
MGRFDRPPFKGNGWVEGKRICWEGEGEVMWLEPYGADSLRFRSSRSLHVKEDLDWTLLAPNRDSATIEVTEHKAVIRNGKIRAEVYGDGTVNYFDASGRPLIEEWWVDQREITVPLRRAREYRAISSEAFAVDLYFKPRADEHFHGLGHDPNDVFDLKGSSIPLEQKNTKCTVPFLVSSLGYGFLWNNPAIGRADLTNNHTVWHADATKQIDYIVIAGDTPDAIMRQYTEITGRAPVLPDWAAGFWQCKLRYETQEELLEVAREYKRRGIPVSVIVCDYFHWTAQGEWKFDPRRWPDPRAMTDELASMGMRLMVSVWPTVDTRSENYLTMRDKNYLVRAERGTSLFKIAHGACTFYDATHPKAREFVWSKVKKNYYDHGIKMFWLDESEPSYTPYDYDNVRYYIGNGSEVSNIYPFYYAQTFYDGPRAAGETEVVNLLRCAWIGSQRYSIVVWSGDIPSTFDSLRRQVKAGLNFSFSGIPWWTTDIGGFFNGDPDDPAFRELLVRWFGFGIYSPIMRLHGFRLPYQDVNRYDPTSYNRSGGANEVWSFGEDNYRILVGMIALRNRLRPYIMDQMKKASAVGTPIMRPLLYDFPEDPGAQSVWDSYMFGPDVLVAPVVEAGQRRRSVYLPAGADWVDPYSGKKHKGGATVEVDAPLDRVAVFLRNGAKVPIVP